ncbi:MAG: M20 family metallo-hydrolase [bacterium]
MDNVALEQICSHIDSYENEAISLQQNLTAIPALAPENDGDGEQKKAEFVQSYLEQALKCDELTNYPAPDKRVSSGNRPNIVAKIKGRDPSKTLWIMSHLDVVPPGELDKWHSNPWEIKVEHGKIIGRGVEDNQQGIVSSFLAVKAFRDTGLQPQINIGLVLVSDEETGSDYGIQYLLEHHKGIFRKEDLILIPDAGIADGTMIEVAEKSIVWLKFRVQGKQTHGSTPDHGVNALKASAHLIVKLNDLYLLYNTEDAVFDPPMSTFEPTKKEANVPNINTIPGEDVFYFDCRLLPDYDVEKFQQDVKKICSEIESRHRVSIEITTEQVVVAAPPTPSDAAIVKALQRAIYHISGKQAQPMGIGGGTVAAFFRNQGFQVAVWATQDETLHEPNEYVKIENIIHDAKVFAHVALQI